VAIRQETRVRLEPTMAACSEARTCILSTLFGWGHRPAIPLVELVATELVSNAVIHARGEVGFCLALEGDHLRVEVSDGAPERIPVLFEVPRGEHGYGLRIVDSLSEHWGYETAGDRKSVWARLDLNVGSTW
jgi:hypothetical protein